MTTATTTDLVAECDAWRDALRALEDRAYALIDAREDLLAGAQRYDELVAYIADVHVRRAV